MTISGAEDKGKLIVRITDESASVGQALEAIAGFCGHNRIDPTSTGKIAIISEELLLNLFDHGGGVQQGAIVLTLMAQAQAVRMVLTDHGPPFDPRAAGPFDGPDMERGGGVGLELIRNWAEIISYGTQDGENRLVLLVTVAQA